MNVFQTTYLPILLHSILLNCLDTDIFGLNQYLNNKWNSLHFLCFKELWSNHSWRQELSFSQIHLRWFSFNHRIRLWFLTCKKYSFAPEVHENHIQKKTSQWFLVYNSKVCCCLYLSFTFVGDIRSTYHRYMRRFWEYKKSSKVLIHRFLSLHLGVFVTFEHIHVGKTSKSKFTTLLPKFAPRFKTKMDEK